MFIGKFKAIFLNPEGIICPMLTFLHKIPSGLRTNCCLFFYKHIFPLGIQDNYTLRHKTDNSVILFENGKLETKNEKKGPLSITGIFGRKIVENRINALILIG
jgi:hypothetical protein